MPGLLQVQLKQEFNITAKGTGAGVLKVSIHGNTNYKGTTTSFVFVFVFIPKKNNSSFFIGSDTLLC